MKNAMVARFGQPSGSEIRLLSQVLRNHEITQPALARATGLSQQTVSRLVNDLEGRGALRWGKKRLSGRRGQPSVSVCIAPDYTYSLGVALMTDAMSVVLMDFSGAVVAYEHCDMQDVSRVAAFARLDEVICQFVAEKGISRDRLCGVGVGISGYCMDGHSRYNPPHALDDWAMVQIDQLFSEMLGLPAWAENDGNASAVGESLLGVGRTQANFVYMFIAAGIGGGVIIDHQLWRGVHGNGGEIGLIRAPGAEGLPTLETLRETLGRNGVALNSLSDMLARFDPDWPGVEEWIQEASTPLSLIASSIAALVDPDVIVVGGRIPPVLAERLIPRITLYDNTRRAEPRPLPRIVQSQTSVDACAIGAAMLPLEKHFFSTML
jgi:predicted NBD/HSP70 family sugar kinase